VAELALEKLKIESSSKEATKIEIITIDAHEVSSDLETACLKKIKPRAIILKANDKDFRKLKDLIDAQFPEVEIIYVTTGPAASILRVSKSMPFELQNSSAQPYYTIE
jgi:excinuclease UvrABC nuclease subunit